MFNAHMLPSLFSPNQNLITSTSNVSLTSSIVIQYWSQKLSQTLTHVFFYSQIPYSNATSIVKRSIDLDKENIWE